MKEGQSSERDGTLYKETKSAAHLLHKKKYARFVFPSQMVMGIQ